MFVAEPNYLDYGLILNFDGISLIKKEDLNNLEELIVKYAFSLVRVEHLGTLFSFVKR